MLHHTYSNVGIGSMSVWHNEIDEVRVNVGCACVNTKINASHMKTLNRDIFVKYSIRNYIKMLYADD